MLKRIFSLLLILGCVVSYAQETNIDSLKKLLAVADSDSARMYLNMKIGSAIGMNDPGLAAPYMKTALELARKTGKKRLEAKLLNSLGGLHFYLGDYNEALRLAISSEKLMEALNDKDGLSDCYNGIALIYSKNNQYDMELKYFKKSLALRMELKDSLGISQSLTNLGGYYEDIEDYDSCLIYYNESLKYAKLVKDVYGEALLLNNIGMIYLKKDNFRAGEDFLLRSIAIKKEIDDLLGVAESNLNLGDLYIALKRYPEAEKHVTYALESSQKLNALELIRDCYQSLSLIHKNRNDINGAFKYLELFMQYKDSVSTEERTRAITEMNARFDSEKKEKEIELLNKDKEKQAALTAEEHKRKNLIIGSVAGGLLLVIIFSVFLYNRFKITQKQKNIIEKQKALVEQKKEEIEKQKELVEEKQKEILDSIHYARRIQRSLMTSEKYITRILSKYKN